MSDERRANPRVKWHRPVRLRFADVDDFLASYCENISLGGVFVQTKEDVAMGTEVELELEVMEGKGFKVTAVVAWIREEAAGHPRGVGLRFEGVSEQHAAWLKEAVDKRVAAGDEAD